MTGIKQKLMKLSMRDGLQINKKLNLRKAAKEMSAGCSSDA